MQNSDSTSVPIIILAGGQSQRLRLDNKYKWQLPFGNKTLLDYIIDKAREQSKHVLINAPYQQTEASVAPLTEYTLPLIHDLLPNFQGPLAGLLSCLHWAKNQGHPWVATMACDTPFFPDDLLHQLYKASQHPDKQINAVTVSSSGRLHPIFGLWSTLLYDTLREHIAEEDSGSITRWAKNQAKVIEIDSIQRGEFTIDPFFNINTLDDYQYALRLNQ